MYECLLHETTFTRLEERLKPFSEQLAPVTVNDDLEIGHPWGETKDGALISYGNTDVWFSPAAKAFAKYLHSAGRLAWFQSSAAGLENPFLQKIGDKAEAYTSSHVQSEAIAEWVLWAGFDWFGNGAGRRAAQAEKDWRSVSFREIQATRWLIYGFGHIGEAVGRRLRGLGAHVTGVRRSGHVSPFADRIIHPQNFEPDNLGQSDAVLLCCPHTPETENLADADFFTAMKEDSLFMNVGRGALVDETALIAALEARRPAHATLDVTREEPLPEDSPLWRHPHLTLTPHTSAMTEDALKRNDELFLENLVLFLNGEPLRNLVEDSAFAAQSV
ncbi:D-2-hydroxyacid dehydrogenase [Henriciella sp.]|uniref:D-2-hydroxyacid dehydrogenase n=1 Tax=Henriciella sp. TaxID=1968823 RepID=UPI00260E7A31|nr:D-2-hydroxyacid dehydrogenase [Henriciella sp.]